MRLATFLLVWISIPNVLLHNGGPVVHNINKRNQNHPYLKLNKHHKQFSSNKQLETSNYVNMGPLLKKLHLRSTNLGPRNSDIRNLGNKNAWFIINGRNKLKWLRRSEFPWIDLLMNQPEYSNLPQDQTSPFPFTQSLVDIDAAGKELQRYLSQPIKLISTASYVVILSVVYGLVEHVVTSQNKNAYDEDYFEVMKKYYKLGLYQPTAVMREFTCTLQAANHEIHNLREIIQNVTKHEFCSETKQNCDWLIFANIIATPELKPQVLLFKEISKLAQLFLYRYSQEFNAASKLGSYDFLKDGKEILKPLVKIIAGIRSKVFGVDRNPCREELINFL